MLSRYLVTAVAYLRSLGVQGSDDAISRLIDRRFGLRSDPDDELRIIGQVALETLGGQAERFDNRADQHRFLEALVYALLESNQPDSIWDLFGAHGELCYPVLGMKRGDFERGRRIMQAVSDRFERSRSEIRYPGHTGASLSHDLALFQIERGYLIEAEARLRALLDGGIGPYLASTCREDLCDVLLLAGRLPEAERAAQEAVEEYSSPSRYSGAPLLGLAECARAGQRAGNIPGSNPFARRAAALALQGKTTDALVDFKRAEAFQRGRLAYGGPTFFTRRGPERRDPGLLQGPPLAGPGSLHYADLLVRLGKLDSAEAVADYHIRWGRSAELPLIEAHAALILGDVARLRGAYRRAARWLDYPAAWAKRSGQQAIRCRAGIALARLKLAQSQYDAARRIVVIAQRIAARCGFRLYDVDAQVLLARLDLVQGDRDRSASRTLPALDLARGRGVQYGWGHSAALHLMGEIELADYHASGQPAALAQARNILTEAAALRREMRDPRLNNTLRLLQDLPGD